MTPGGARLFRLLFAGIAVRCLGFAQNVALSLSSGSAARGGSVTLSLSVNSLGTQPADLQWTLNYSTTDFSAVSVAAGSAATAASKLVTCNSVAGNLTCLLYGINSSTIANGVVATITLTVSNSTLDTSSAVQVTNAGSASEPGLTVSTAAAGASVTIIQPVTYTISGTITGAGVSGATVALTGAATASTTTNASGAYSFTGLANGSYTANPTLSGYSYTPASTAVTVSGADQTANFTGAAATYTISGTITGAGVSGATVALTGAATASTTTNGSGAYSFTGLANGSYTVTPTLSGYSYTPASAAVTVSGADQTANFTGAAATYTISGTITGAGVS